MKRIQFSSVLYKFVAPPCLRFLRAARPLVSEPRFFGGIRALLFRPFLGSLGVLALGSDTMAVALGGWRCEQASVAAYMYRPPMSQA